MYTDAGVSGLSIRRRDGFNRMVADALDGKLDLIVTKSLSRFARNTVDALTTIRNLKAAGVPDRLLQGLLRLGVAFLLYEGNRMVGWEIRRGWYAGHYNTLAGRILKC